MRMIDADKLIIMLDAELRDNSDYLNIHEQIKDIIDYLQTGWISVSKRLPEKKGYYLTSTVFNEVYCDFWNGGRFARTEEILAWMPLPEHYKKEE